jgi:hypothetical protein
MQILILLGWLIALIGSIWFLVVAFQESVLWGLACLFIPFVGLVFLVMHFDRAAKPFFISLAGSILAVIGALAAGDSLEGVSRLEEPQAIEIVMEA